MEPKTPPMPWEEFYRTKGPRAIAIDGYVDGPPIFDPSSACANFDHHARVHRPATRATCGQVYFAVKRNLFLSFRNGSKESEAKVFANHPDEDVCLSWALLKWASGMPEMLETAGLSHLVNLVDLIDASSGSFPVSEKIWQEIAWVFQSYRRFRMSGEIDRQDAREYSAVVTETEDRIAKYVRGQGESLALDTRYEKIGAVKLKRSGIECAIIREKGAQARIRIVSDGILFYLSVRERPGGNWTDTLVKTSPFIPIDLSRVYQALNSAEKCGAHDRWGGGTDVGGSPRVRGTSFSPSQVARIVAEVY
ncbi:MAG: hypothetical protein Q7S70_00010 [bacterium]|nr:hypothetical protein [bacterium]